MSNLFDASVAPNKDENESLFNVHVYQNGEDSGWRKNIEEYVRGIVTDIADAKTEIATIKKLFQPTRESSKKHLMAKFKGSVTLATNTVTLQEKALFLNTSGDGEENFETFISGCLQLINSLKRLEEDLPFPIHIRWPETQIKAVFKILPDYVKKAIFSTLDMFPSWEKRPGEISKLLDERNFKLPIYWIDICLIFLNLIKDVLPKDLSITFSILGEGIGTEIMGHPSKLIVAPIISLMQFTKTTLHYIEK